MPGIEAKTDYINWQVKVEKKRTLKTKSTFFRNNAFKEITHRSDVVGSRNQPFKARPGIFILEPSPITQGQIFGTETMPRQRDDTHAPLLDPTCEG